MHEPFEFEPPVDEESLTGGANPKAQVEERIIENDDSDWTVFDGESHHAPGRRPLKQEYAAYVLGLHRCKHRTEFVELVERKLERDPRDYEWAAWYQDELFYVGYTRDLYKRIPEHVKRVESSAFLDVFPVYRLRAVQFAGNRPTDAKALEEEIARELNGRENTFAYSDQLIVSR